MMHTLTDIVLWFLIRGRRRTDCRMVSRLFGDDVHHDLDHLVELRILRKSIDYSSATTYYQLCYFPEGR